VTTLQTERLTLRTVSLDDAELAGQLVGDERVMRFMGGSGIPRDAWQVIVEKWVERWDRNGMGNFMVFRRDNGAFVGRTGILVWDTRTWTPAMVGEAGDFAQPELGWVLAYDHWGNGYATEAARAARDWVRADRGVTRLISVIAPENVASQRVAERLGATPGETVELFDTGHAVVWEHP
jgi:RimJ/RimL family protein N-acetyltransferase